MRISDWSSDVCSSDLSSLISTDAFPMTKLQLLIDTDPGVDDALAILMAYAHADIAGLSIAAGNVGLGHTVRNARILVDLVGATTPVFAGCAAPLVRAPEADAAFVHGQDRKRQRLNSSHYCASRIPSSACQKN